MEKRYQVFISSTSKDLQAARREVSQALLRSDCFPAQMELWPAADEEQFEFIKQIIRQSDYYIVISAGMYGSIHPDTGLSYTEMEFDYAQEIGLPTIRFLHSDPLGSLKGSHIEGTDNARQKLLTFRQKLLTGKLCAFWETPEELGREVILGLNDLIKSKPRKGWVKADQIASTDAIFRIAELTSELSEYKRRQENLLSIKIPKFLNSITGTVTVVHLELDESEGAPWDYPPDNDSVIYLYQKYNITNKKIVLEGGKFAYKFLYGLLFSEDATQAIYKGFSSVKTNGYGYPVSTAYCPNSSELEDIFMALESQGIINAGRMHAGDSPGSYIVSYPWQLSAAGREWIIGNKPN